MKKPKTTKKGALPKNIDKIINESLKTINFYHLRSWLAMNRLQLKVADSEVYRMPTDNDMRKLITKTIKLYYLWMQEYKSVVTKQKYFYGVDTSPDNYVVAGFSVINQGDHFLLDFCIYESDDEGKLYYDKSYLSYIEGHNYILLNKIGNVYH